MQGLCKVLAITLMRYQDSQSRRLVLDFADVLSCKHPVAVCKHIHSCIDDSVGNWRNTWATASISKPCLAALAWSVATARPEAIKEDTKKVIEVQSFLAGVILSTGGRTVSQKAKKLLETCWGRDGVVEMYVQAIDGMDNSLYLAILATQLFDYLVRKEKKELAGKVKTFVTELVTKSVLMSKTKFPQHSVNKLEPFFRQLSEDEFKSSLVPVMNKALLRSPEMSLSVVSVLLSSVNIDLSSLASDLGQTFCTNLKSKDDAIRDDAVKATKALVVNCKEESAVEKLMESIFSTLGGSGGKISLNSVKVSLLIAAGNMTLAGVNPTCLTSLATAATKKFVKFLQDETHEATLITGLEQLSLWTKHYSITIPEEFLAQLQKILGEKNASTGVKSGYLMCLQTALTVNTAASASGLTKTLMGVVEAGKTSGQAAPVAEAVIAANCLLTIQTDPALLLGIIADTDKCPLYQDKFVCGAGAGPLAALASVVTTLLTKHTDALTNEAVLYKCLALCLLSPSSHVRGQAVRNVTGLGKTLGGVSDMVKILGEVGKVMMLKNVTRDRIDSGQGGELGASDSVSVTSVLSSVAGIVSHMVRDNWSQEDKVRIALALIPILHNPVVLSADRKVWSRTLSKLGLQPKETMDNNGKELLDMGHKAYVKKVKSGERTLYRVYVGPKVEKSRLEGIQGEINQRFGVETLITRYYP